MNPSTCDIVALPHFESLPPETRNVIYTSFQPNRTIFTRQPTCSWPFRYIDEIAIDLGGMKLSGGSIIDVPLFQILRTNDNINQEALAVLYQDVLLVSIDWNQSERTYLSLFRMLQDVPFFTPFASPRQQVCGTTNI